MTTKKIVPLGFKAFFLAIAVSFAFAGLVLAYNLEPYYPLGEGNNWRYSIMEDTQSHEESVRIEGKDTVNGVETVKVVNEGGSYQCMALDSEGLKRYKFQNEEKYGIYNMPKVFFPTIGMGEVKETSSTATVYSLDGAEIGEVNDTCQITLESIEDVTVPSGRFVNCLKYKSICEWRESAGSYGRKDCSTWLAVGVGKVKEFCSDTVFDAEEGREETYIEAQGLISAVIDGETIEGQEAHTE